MDVCFSCLSRSVFPAVNRAAHQGLIRSRGLCLGQRQCCNTLQNRTSHQGKVNCDHSHADRSTASSIHLLPPPVRVDVIACAAALGSVPPSTSSAAARLLLPGTSLRLLSRSRNQRFSHIVKDWLYGFFCLYKQFSDPCQKKKVNFQLQKRDGPGTSRGMWDALLSGMWAKQMTVRRRAVLFSYLQRLR